MAMYEIKEPVHIEMRDHGRVITFDFAPGTYEGSKDADQAMVLEHLAAQGIAVPVKAPKAKES